MDGSGVFLSDGLGFPGKVTDIVLRFLKRWIGRAAGNDEQGFS